MLPGDPTTPGYPSKPGSPRVDPHGSTPSIPSLPISYADALPLLKALNGLGPNATAFNKYWQGGGLAYKGVDYNVGPSKLELNLYNQQEYVTTPIWNVIGVVNGSIADEVVLIGNHRDAWVAGGAGDPNSGSAVLNEVIRSVGTALAFGWKPLRTIVFASWDGEEYGLVGSTEWVEEYIPWLSASAVAYFNVDVGARGDKFSVSASPMLNSLIYNVTGSVAAPGNDSKTVRDTWDGHIGTMGSGSDFTSFQDYAGIASIDFGYGAGPTDPVYHYHSNYDSFGWMEKFGDPGWHHHTTMAQILGLFAITLSETPIIALSASDYARALEKYLEQVKKQAEESATKLSFSGLDLAILDFQHTATRFDDYTAELASRLTEDVPWWEFWKKVRLYYDVRKANQKYKMLERHFLYEKGLDSRSWFKHVVFAPGRWTGYSGATFPGLMESLEDNDAKNAKRWAGIIERLIVAARESLE
jgi:N-acetylated-alpha-linked acidic dipeptidase